MASAIACTRLGAQVSLKPTSLPAGKAAAARAPVARAVSCSAQKQESNRAVSTGVAAAALALTFGFGAVDAAYADVAGLTPCSESKAFAKREKNELKSLQERLKNYEADSAPVLTLNGTMEEPKARFANYGKQGLLRGTDGLLHLIAVPGFVLIPTIVIFIYLAGSLGFAVAKYIQAVKAATMIIDFPLAWRMLREGFSWPLRAFVALRQLLEKNKAAAQPAAGGEGGSGGSGGPRLRREELTFILPRQQWVSVHVTQRDLDRILTVAGAFGFEVADGKVSRRLEDLPEGGTAKLVLVSPYGGHAGTDS